MGGKAKEILPLVALAGIGIATGGFGLLGAGAAGAAGAGATATAGAAAGAAASSGGFLSGLAADLGQMSALSKIGLGLQAVASVGGMAKANAAADQQNAMLALQQGQQNFADATNALGLSQRALATQQRLRKTLAALNVHANAFGADLSSGSASNLMDSVFMGAQNASGLLNTKRQMLDQNGRTADQVYAYKRRAVGTNRTGGIVSDLLGLGLNAAKTLNKNNAIGRF